MRGEKAIKTRGQVLTGLFLIGLLGAICGALIAHTFDGEGAVWRGALLAGAYFVAGETLTTLWRGPAEVKPLAHRLIISVLMGAALGGLLGLLLDDPITLGLLVGLAVGAATFGPRKFILGLVTGFGLGVGAAVFFGSPNPALLAGVIVLTYRLLLLLIFPGTQAVQFMAEWIEPGQAPYVVPFEAQTRRIGGDYMQALAANVSGTYQRNQPDIGIVETMDDLRGPHFDPAQVHPLVREFYEHTSRFKLSIIPEWNRLVQPLFFLFKTLVARPVNQMNLPFNIKEAQRGVVSAIDTIEYDPTGAGHIQTLRGWVRTFQATGQVIYVGIYTVVRHQDVGYVSVGFPLPEANLTATLLPYNDGDGGFLLKTHGTGVNFSGHYLTFIDAAPAGDEERLTILELPTLAEEIAVSVQDGALKTEHRFYLGGMLFLTLHYVIERRANGSTNAP
jgi:hypothetical protein